MSAVFKRLPLNEKGELIKGEYALKSPRNLVFISQKKTGKTLSAANVPKIMIGDCEKGTIDFGFPVNNKVDLTRYEGTEEFIKVGKYGWLPAGLVQLVDDLGIANKMDVYWKLFEAFDENANKKNYDALIAHIQTMMFPLFFVDTITSFIELSNSAALQEYNMTVKAENRKFDIKKIDDFGGVRMIRSKFSQIKNFIEKNAAPFTIYSGHLAERKKIFRKDPEDISTVDIDLEGVQSKSFTVRANAIGIFQRTNEGCFIDFTKKDESDTGIRVAHLSNKIIKIADYASSEQLEKGIVPKTYWSELYPEVDFS
jgi:hypothetical protein